MPESFHLYNTLTKRIEPFRATDPSRVTFYTCGPTVYDDVHIGNFRTFLVADLLRRWLESPLCAIQDAQGRMHAGPRTVRHAMNITDVGHMTDDAVADGGGVDKMDAARIRLLEAKKSGKLPAGSNVDPKDPFAIAEFYAQRFIEDAQQLGLKVASQPDYQPRATQHIPQMLDLIARLIDRRCAYVVGDTGSRVVYFDVSSLDTYGVLSGNTLDSLLSGAGGRVQDSNQQAKRNHADFMLWKEDEHHLMKWDSPWGAGYPGWHIECSAMAIEVLARETLRDGVAPGKRPLIDLHSGGEDLIFPHHECEIAQSSCAFNETPSGAPFARQWQHTRFLLVDGQKMSKSKGNFFTARDLFKKGVEPAALRLALIRTHYRTNADFTEQLLKDSQRMIDRWRRVQDADAPGGPQRATLAATQAFAEAMRDDLNIAAAVAAINTMVGALESPTRGDAEALLQLDNVLGVLELECAQAADTSIGLFAPGLAPDPAVIEKLELRRAARASKDFATSDAIRDELAGMGYAIKDVAGGKVEVTRA